MKEITGLRQEIDRLDQELMELLEKRFKLSSQVISKKHDLDLGTYDGNREEFILDRAQDHGLKVLELYQQLLRISKEK